MERELIAKSKSINGNWMYTVSRSANGSSSCLYMVQMNQLSAVVIISSTNDLNAITMGDFYNIMPLSIVGSKYERNTYIHEQRRYDQLRTMFG
jgi:hypothetical protein